MRPCKRSSYYCCTQSSQFLLSLIIENSEPALHFAAFPRSNSCRISSQYFKSNQRYTYLLLNGIPGKTTTSDSYPCAFINGPSIFGKLRVLLFLRICSCLSCGQFWSAFLIQEARSLVPLSYKEQ